MGNTLPPMRVRLTKLICILLIGGSYALAQKTGIGSDVKQDAKNSSCSNIVALHGDITIRCSGLTVGQANQLKLILNTIL
jgi:hypothetical protein